MTLVRAGKSLQIQLPVSASIRLCSPDLHGRYPFVLHLRAAGVFDRNLAIVSGFENKAGLMRLLGAVKSPLITRALVRGCRNGRTRGHLLALLPAQLAMATRARKGPCEIRQRRACAQASNIWSPCLARPQTIRS